jgi:RNA polymerase sigma-70 factor (ECF subfamily)
MSYTLDHLPDQLRAMRLQFEAVLEPHRPALWSYCLHLTGSCWDAEDLVQEAMLKAFANLANLWQPVHPRAYLFRIASNAWIDRVRRERLLPLEDLDAHAERGQEPGFDDRLHVREAILHLVRLLPARQRIVFLLAEAFEFRAGEIAAMLGTTEGGVKAALHRARAAIAGAQGAPEVLPTRLGREGRVDPLAERYIEAFNARDPDAIAALLHEDAVTTIVGSAEELGRTVSRSASLAEWAADPIEQWVRPGLLDGRDALFVFYRTPEHEEALAWIITLEVSREAIHAQRQYYFCPELIRYAAEALGVPALTHGYQYVIPVG